ncbi:hypothetical protein CCZ01_09025 [Helicobacter monodelphidis]|uniref:TonB-dependent receptor n=1 Tax=Helicobacter sp. 15-1451 TaxID=2004995 RepID=UPI000DCDB8F1|nr:TonB-dependent receptor [Helicobacter sp. 15-1451]RAX56611.1 hypothetical protein CCZ01_09025 [Helicobacter sp. 15-1451]
MNFTHLVKKRYFFVFLLFEVSLVAIPPTPIRLQSQKNVNPAIYGGLEKHYIPPAEKKQEGSLIYNAERLKNSQAMSLYEFLQQNTNLVASPSYGNPFAFRFSMRGFGENGYQNIAVVIDSVRYENIDMSVPILSLIPIEAIERIEILKNRGIVEYGDGASGGVIIINTKKQQGGLINLAYGSYQTYDGRVYGRYIGNGFNVGAFGQGFMSDGNRKILDNGIEKTDEKQNVNGGLNLIVTPDDSVEMRAGLNYGKFDVKYPGAISFEQFEQNPASVATSFNHQIYDALRANAGFSYHFTPNFKANVDYHFQQANSEYLGQSPSVSEYNTHTGRINVDYVGENLYFLAGLDYKNRLRQDDSQFSQDLLHKDSLSYYALMHYHFLDIHKIELGGRYEQVQYSREATMSTNIVDEHKQSLSGFEAGYVLSPISQLDISLHYMRAYQAPDVDRFFRFGGGFNEFIDTQTSNSYELAITWTPRQFTLNGNLFWIDLDKEIYYNPVTFINSNLDKSNKKGAEVSIAYHLNSEFSTGVEYAYTLADFEYNENGNIVNKTLPGVSTHLTSLFLNYRPISPILISASYKLGSSPYAYEDFSNTTKKQPPYQNLDLTLSYRLNEFEIYAYGRNLLGHKNAIMVREDAYYPYDFERSFGGGLKFSF